MSGVIDTFMELFKAKKEVLIFEAVAGNYEFNAVRENWEFDAVL
jgi:hypothetical protein